MNDRNQVLKHNRAVRDGSLPAPTRLEDGEVVFKIPQQDFKVLQTIYPDLVSKNHADRLKAWKELRNSPVGEQYLVTRTPKQVKKSSGGIIIK